MRIKKKFTRSETATYAIIAFVISHIFHDEVSHAYTKFIEPNQVFIVVTFCFGVIVQMAWVLSVHLYKRWKVRQAKKKEGPQQ